MEDNTYEITLSTLFPFAATIEIKAKSEEEACEKAMAMLEPGGERIDWEECDRYTTDAEIADVQLVEGEEPEAKSLEVTIPADKAEVMGFATAPEPPAPWQCGISAGGEVRPGLSAS